MNHMSDGDQSPRAVFGFKEFWPKVYAKYERQFDAIDDLVRLGNEIVKVAEESADEPMKNVICALTGATMSGAREVLLLCGNGCGTGAMKIVRGMYESRWTAEYLRRNPKEVQDYLEFSKVILRRKLDWQTKNVPKKADCIPGDVKKKVEDDYNNVKARFTDGNSRERRNWLKKSIYAMAKDIGCEKEYDLPYAIASSIHHVNFEGLSALFTSDGEAVTPNPPPSVAWVKKALISAHVNLWFALNTANDACGLDFLQKLEAAQPVP